MKSLLPEHLNLLDNNSLTDNLTKDEGCFDKAAAAALTDFSKGSLIPATENLFVEIIAKAKGLIGDIGIEKLCRSHGIKINGDDGVTIRADIYETLNNFIDNLIQKGGNIIKIMLHNISHDIDLTSLETVFNKSNRNLFICSDKKNFDRDLFF